MASASRRDIHALHDVTQIRRIRSSSRSGVQKSVSAASRSSRRRPALRSTISRRAGRWSSASDTRFEQQGAGGGRSLGFVFGPFGILTPSGDANASARRRHRHIPRRRGRRRRACVSTSRDRRDRSRQADWMRTTTSGRHATNPAACRRTTCSTAARPSCRAETRERLRRGPKAKRRSGPLGANAPR
jgi:hypothetical protein